jgi:hypothetical protein
VLTWVLFSYNYKLVEGFMRKRLLISFGAVLLILLTAGLAAAFTIDLYESADGINPPGPGNPPTERPPVITLPGLVGPGVVRVWEWDPALQSQYPQIPFPYGWISDFLYFQDNGSGLASTVQLLSDPFTKAEVDFFMSIFPFADVVETAPPTIYDVGNVYRIWSDAPEAIPVPPTALLLGSGLLGLLGWRRFKI